MNSFVYDIPTKVYFGEDQLSNLGPELARFGRRVMLTYGGGSIKKSGLYDKIAAEVKKAELELFELGGIEPNPRVESVRKGAELCKKDNIDVLLAVGGGSTIDATKYIAAGACVDFDPWDFFSKWAPIEKALPVVTVLTLAATGSEMDSGGVISNPDTNDKMGRLDPLLQPKVSFLDPAVTYSVSAYQTACGSSDILSHIIETYFIPAGTNMYLLDTFMEGQMKTVIKYAPAAIAQPDSYEARANLMWASSWAINGFTRAVQTCAWSCHPMEHELSAIYDITHGLGLAILTPRWMEYVLDETTAPRFRQFGVNVFGIDASLPQMEAAKKSISMLSDFFFKTLGLKSTLRELGIDDSNFALMAKKACGDGVLEGFKPLRQNDIEKIYRMCL